MNILGLSAYYHDSAACLVTEGRIVAAAQEERWSRQKHDHRFPSQAIQLLSTGGGPVGPGPGPGGLLRPPFLKFERLLETYLAFAPSGTPFLSAGHAPLDQGKTLAPGED